MKRYSLLMIGIVSLMTAFSPVLEAGITNNGGEAIMAKIKKTGGRFTNTAINPGQTVLLPADAVSVTINPYFPIRGDEDINVKIIDADGEDAKITSFGRTFVIGEKFKKKTAEEKAKIENKSNVTVIAIAIKASGAKTKKRLYPNDIWTLPTGTEYVSVMHDGRVWGDEKVKCKVTLSDTSTVDIERFGGKTSLAITE